MCRHPVEWDDGAILANGSVDAKDKLSHITGLPSACAAQCVNPNGIGSGRMRIDGDTGVYYHKTVRNNESSYGVLDKDGKYKVTCLYETKGDNAYYIVALASHNGTERRRGKPVDKYKVQKSLKRTIPERAGVHFI